MTRTRLIIRYIPLFILLTTSIFTRIYAQTSPLRVTSLDWSADGRLIAVGWGYEYRAGCASDPIEVIDQQTSQTTLLTGHTCNITGLSFNPDGTKLVSQSHDGYTIIWDVTNGTKIEEKYLMIPKYEVNWSPDGNYLVANVGQRDLAVGQVLPSLHGIRGFIEPIDVKTTDMTWSPDSISIASSYSDGTVQIWTALTGLGTRTFAGHGSVSVESVAWNPVGGVIASGDANGVIKLWNPTTGYEITTLTGHTGAINSLAWSPNGRGLVSASSDGSVRVWQMGTYTTAATFQYNNNAPVYAVDWNNDSTKIVYGGEGNSGLRGEAVIQVVSVLLSTPPTADAGLDQIVAGNGVSAQVQLDGTGSFDSDGTVTNYTWTEGGQTIGTGINPLVSLGVGTHTITLTVTDNDGGTGTDEVVITVLSQTATPTLTPSLTPSITPTPSQTPTASSTFTASPYPSWTPTPNK